MPIQIQTACVPPLAGQLQYLAGIDGITRQSVESHDFGVPASVPQVFLGDLPQRIPALHLVNGVSRRRRLRFFGVHRRYRLIGIPGFRRSIGCCGGGTGSTGSSGFAGVSGSPDSSGGRGAGMSPSVPFTQSS